VQNLPAVQSPFAEPNAEIDLRRAWLTISRSAWIIVVCVGLSLAAAVVAVQRVQKTYAAQATVRIENQTKTASKNAITYLGGQDYSTSIAVAEQIIRSRSLAQLVVDELGLRLSVESPLRTQLGMLVASASTKPDAPSQGYRLMRVNRNIEVHSLVGEDTVYGVYPDTGEIHLIGGSLRLTSTGRATDRINLQVRSRLDVSEALRSSITVEQTNKDANVVAIGYSGPDSLNVLKIPNAVAYRFVTARGADQVAAAKAQTRYLKEQELQLETDAAGYEAQVQEYLEKEGVPSIDQQSATLGGELQQLESVRRELQSQKDNINRAMETLREPDTVGIKERWLRRLQATPDFFKTGAAAADAQAVDQLILQRQELMLKLYANNQQVRDLDKKINERYESVRIRTLTYLTNLDAQIAAIEPRMRALNAKLLRVPEQRSTLNKMLRNQKIVESMIELVQTRLKEAEINAAVTDSSASVLDEAMAAGQQTTSSTTLIFAVAVFSGLFVGLSVAFLRDWLDTTIRTEVDLANIVGVTVVGIIPNLQQQARSVGYRLPTPADGDENKPAAGREYQTPAAEAYRTLRTNLNYLTPPRPPRVIVVTSALPGDGKTTTVVNLAVTLAHAGQRVILIDAETRRGTVHDVFGIPPAPGFFDLMYGQASPGECIRRVQMEGGGTLDVLPLGSAPSVNPADLLVAGRLQPLFERLRSQYDYVLIDTPPLNLFTDGALIGAHADALLLVARADKTDREELKFAVQQLRNVNVTLAGTILNDVEFRRSSRYRLGYGYYYDYAR
jgi:capsular exopolysaccharide synthesis family protein